MSESKRIVIRSSANPTVRRLIRMRDNRARRRAGCVLVDGRREAGQAIKAGLELCGIFRPESQLSEEANADKADNPTLLVEDRYVDSVDPNLTTWVSDTIMDKISYGDSNRGLVAEFRQPKLSLAELKLPANPILLVLDRVEKPGNIGAVFRSADAAGVDAVLMCDSGDVFNPNAIRSSLGCVFHVPMASGSEIELSGFLHNAGIKIVAARVEAAVSIWEADLSAPLAIVLGSETDGLGGRWQKYGNISIDGVSIPMSGSIDSLNISVSAAVVCYEAMRRRVAGD